MKQIKTEIIINAPKEKIWNILTDLENYQNWNPFITKSIGKVQLGQQLTNTILLEGQKDQVFKPKIIGVNKGNSFRWLGSLFFKGLFDGEHYFELESIHEQQTKLIHGENFSGIFSGIILKMIREATIQGFEKMNKALKTQAEQQ